MSYQIDAEDIPDIALGATFLGTGGGGEPYIGQLFAQTALREEGPVTVLAPDELDDDDFVIPTGGMGAPTIGIERPRQGLEPVWALQGLERRLQRRADATMPVECGGGNSLVPIMTAARAHLPVVDADGMGRAFPELQMETFGVHGVRADPMTLASSHHDLIVIETGDIDNARIEWLARGEVVRLGGAAAMALYPMTGEQVKRTAIPGTLSMCRKIGKTLKEVRERRGDPVDALQEVFQESPYGAVRALFRGKIVDVLRRNERGFTVGRAKISGYDHEEYELIFQNENLLVQSGGETLCTVPNLIVTMEEDKRVPITTQSLRYGQRVVGIGVSAPEAMCSPEALAVFGPRRFGLDTDYQPVV
jgi:DUF917 family protein